jgi:hypothetical protein
MRFALLSLGLVWACGSTSGPVLERRSERVPPESTNRVDVFLVSHVASCAIGRPCATSDADACFFVERPTETLYFDRRGLELVAADDPRIASAEQSACFELELDESARAGVSESFSTLRSRVFQLSDGQLDLDLRLHVVAPEVGDFKLWEGGSGLFLQPSSLESSGLPLMSPDSDFVFAITGEGDLAGQAQPKIDPCGGTNWQAQGALGGTAYTWLATSCVSDSSLLWQLMYQAYFAVRDVQGVEGPYGNGYPACGKTSDPPASYFPRPSDCLTDPDAPECGRTRCDEAAFAQHVLTAHWPRQPGLVGNHCRNGRQDFDETGPDVGGVCGVLGR